MSTTETQISTFSQLPSLNFGLVLHSTYSLACLLVFFALLSELLDDLFRKFSIACSIHSKNSRQPLGALPLPSPAPLAVGWAGVLTLAALVGTALVLKPVDCA